MNKPAPTIRRPATYQDVLDAPPNMVAELVRGALHPRSAAGAGSALMVRALATGDVLALGVAASASPMAARCRAPAPDGWLAWHLNGVALLFAATHASFVGLLARSLAPELSGEALHALTQIGTIAAAYRLRQWLGVRYGRLGGAIGGPPPVIT